MYFTNPVFENIPLLAKPILHYTIFGVAPREIMGEAAFKKVKAEVQARADHHCEICGRYVAHTMRTQDWIHTHEVYHVNHNEHLLYFPRICRHLSRMSFIYPSRLSSHTFDRGLNYRKIL